MSAYPPTLKHNRIATMAAVGFAGLLVVIMRSDEIRTVLFDLVKSALTFTNPNATTE